MKIGNGQKQNKEILLSVAKNAGWFLLSVAFFAVLWAAAYAAVGNDYILSSLGASLRSAVLLLGSSLLWKAFFSTFLRALEAFFLSLMLAVPLALVSDAAPAFNRFFAPVVSALRSLPTMAILLMLLVWSTPAVSPVIVAFLALFPILYTAMKAALAAVDGNLVEMSKVYRVPLQRRIFQMYLPIVSPYLLREGAAAIAFSLKLIVSAEVMANTYKSMGGLLQESKIYTDMPRLFALTLIVILLGMLLEGGGILLARAAERRVR